MNRIPGIRETLARVAALRDALRGLAARAAQLEEGFRAEAAGLARHAGAEAQAAAAE